MRVQLRDLLEANRVRLANCAESKEFPWEIIEEFKKIGFNGFNVKGFGSPELSIIDSSAMMYELGKSDVGLALFVFVQNCIGIQVYDTCCSDEQK